MNRKAGHIHAGLRRRVRADAARRSTRRKLLVAAAAWPALGWARAVFAQAKQPPAVIGWFYFGSREAGAYGLAAFKQGLAALGLKVGSQVVIEERWADGRSERLQQLAVELAALRPAVIVGTPSQCVAAAAKAAPGTPIVQATGGDLVRAGLAASLARPGGMITGLVNVAAETTEKNLEILLAVAPGLRRIGFLVDPTNVRAGGAMDAVRRSVAKRSVEPRFAEAAVADEIEPALLRLAKEGAQALIIIPSPLFMSSRRRIVKIALAHGWPLIAWNREWAEDGALFSYGADSSANYRRAAYYVDRILKGAKPGELPIEQPTTVELIINMNTAKALKLEIPRELALRADRVIE